MLIALMPIVDGPGLPLHSHAALRGPDGCHAERGHAIGLSGEVDPIEPGKKADLVLLDAPDHRHMGHRLGSNLVRYVIKAGSSWWRKGSWPTGARPLGRAY